MSLIRKIFHEVEPHSNNHVLPGLLRMWFRGHVSKVGTRNRIEEMFTRAQAGVAYTLTQTELDQLDEWEAHYQGLSDDTERNSHLATLESTCVLAEHGAGVYISKAQFKTANGIISE